MSGLNCKPGDLAVVVIGDHAGVVLTCLQSFQQRVYMPDHSVRLVHVWETDRALRGCLGKTDCFIEDELLKPLRDPGDDAVDETLLWSTPGDRAQRDHERCKRLVAEMEGQS